MAQPGGAGGAPGWSSPALTGGREEQPEEQPLCREHGTEASASREEGAARKLGGDGGSEAGVGVWAAWSLAGAAKDVFSKAPKARAGPPARRPCGANRLPLLATQHRWSARCDAVRTGPLSP